MLEMELEVDSATPSLTENCAHDLSLSLKKQIKQLYQYAPDFIVKSDLEDYRQQMSLIFEQKDQMRQAEKSYILKTVLALLIATASGTILNSLITHQSLTHLLVQVSCNVMLGFLPSLFFTLAFYDNFAHLFSRKYKQHRGEAQRLEEQLEKRQKNILKKFNHVNMQAQLIHDLDNYALRLNAVLGENFSTHFQALQKTKARFYRIFQKNKNMKDSTKLWDTLFDFYELNTQLLRAKKQLDKQQKIERILNEKLMQGK